MSSVSLTSPVRGSKLPGRKIKGDLIKTLAIYLPAIGIAYEGHRLRLDLQISLKTPEDTHFTQVDYLLV